MSLGALRLHICCYGCVRKKINCFLSFSSNGTIFIFEMDMYYPRLWFLHSLYKNESPKIKTGKKSILGWHLRSLPQMQFDMNSPDLPCSPGSLRAVLFTLNADRRGGTETRLHSSVRDAPLLHGRLVSACPVPLNFRSSCTRNPSPPLPPNDQLPWYD